MSDERDRLYSEEASALVRERIESLKENYGAVRDAYQTPYNWPNLDPVRHEIALCVILGMPQAAITLTNHLLESLLKETLVIHHSKDAIRDSGDDLIQAFVKGTEEAREAYGDAPLGRAMNALKRAGLISKSQWKDLDSLRENVRNAYSHADRSKIFRGATIPIQPMKVENGQIITGESQIVKVAEMTIGQGLVQAHIAQSEATSYFLYVDNLARELWEKLFPEASERGAA